VVEEKPIITQTYHKKFISTAIETTVMAKREHLEGCQFRHVGIMAIHITELIISAPKPTAGQDP
jgi:hypothetical protein